MAWQRLCGLCQRPEAGPFGPFTALWQERAAGESGLVVCRPCFLLSEIPRIIAQCPDDVDLRRLLGVLDLAYTVARDLEVGYAAEAIAEAWRRSAGCESERGQGSREAPASGPAGPPTSEAAS